MEGKTHFEFISGGTDEEKVAAKQELQDLFDEKTEEFAEYELEKTPEDLELITKTESIVDRMTTQYGGESKPLPLNHIHILKPESVSAMTDGKLENGIHYPMTQRIVVEKGESQLLFASFLAHELFHLKSFKSGRVGSHGEGVRLYRTGLSMIDRKDTTEEGYWPKEYFGVLEEAIVAECTKKFLDELRQDPAFAEEFQAVAKLRNWVMGYYRTRGVPEEKIK